MWSSFLAPVVLFELFPLSTSSRCSKSNPFSFYFRCVMLLPDGLTSRTRQLRLSAPSSRPTSFRWRSQVRILVPSRFIFCVVDLWDESFVDNFVFSFLWAWFGMAPDISQPLRFQRACCGFDLCLPWAFIYLLVLIIVAVSVAKICFSLQIPLHNVRPSCLGDWCCYLVLVRAVFVFYPATRTGWTSKSSIRRASIETTIQLSWDLWAVIRCLLYWMYSLWVRLSVSKAVRLLTFARFPRGH